MSRRSRPIKARRVYVAASRRLAGSPPLMIPTRWVKFLFAIFLLPVCAILTQTFFTVFARATITQRLWAGQEFWFFSLGAVLWLMGGRVSRFRVGRDGGHVVTNRTNFWIALAPYFFPLYSILAIAIYGVLSVFYNVQPYGRLLYAVIGATWAFHLTFTCWMIPKNQTDLRDHGTFFSVAVIYLMNLGLLSAMLIVASPHITFVSFGADLAKNLGNFSQWVGDLSDKFVQGAHH